MSATRRQVLSVFKTLHRTAQTVFRGDPRAMVMARDKIEADFKKNKSVTKQEEIEELVNFARDCNKVLREDVIQARVTPRGTYSIDLRKENLHENQSFKDDITREEYREAVRKARREKQQQPEVAKGCGLSRRGGQRVKEDG